MTAKIITVSKITELPKTFRLLPPDGPLPESGVVYVYPQMIPAPTAEDPGRRVPHINPVTRQPMVLRFVEGNHNV